MPPEELTKMLAAIFGDDRHLTIAQECTRAVVVFGYGLLLVRAAGRRVFGKWSALDIVVSIVIGSNLSRAVTGTAPFVGTLVATTVLVALHWLLARAAAQWPAVSRIVEGRAIDLFRDGRIDHRARLRHSVSHADLDEALRQSSVPSLDDARQATLEPSGKITILRSG